MNHATKPGFCLCCRTGKQNENKISNIEIHEMRCAAALLGGLVIGANHSRDRLDSVPYGRKKKLRSRATTLAHQSLFS
ncbi:MAG: hypothetical protein JWO13_386 [Acidobacteriales bacterium]|nr:hypothetical protein [Terriglobales bacterium]